MYNKKFGFSENNLANGVLKIWYYAPFSRENPCNPVVCRQEAASRIALAATPAIRGNLDSRNAPMVTSAR